MLDEIIGTTDILRFGETELRNDGSQLARSGRDTMCSRPVSGREHLSRNDESGGIGTKV